MSYRTRLDWLSSEKVSNWAPKKKRERKSARLRVHDEAGLVLHGSSAVEYILEQMRQHHDERDFLTLLLQAIDRRSLHQNFVDEEAARRAVSLITMDVTSKVEEESLKVISAFDCPRHRYHESRKTFLLIPGKPVLHGSAEDQAEMFRHRFELIRQRVTRHPLFATHKLTTVKSLLGATGRKIVFGMLTRNSAGDLILEDLNNTVVIDVSSANIEEGLYTDHCMVLADGELKQGKFIVHVLTMPPLEEAATTLATFANVDMFGGAPDQALRHEIELYQTNAEHVMLVVLSDVWLDKPASMAKLETLFEGYQDIVPTAFVFLGNYTSRPFAQTADDVAKLQASFLGLTRLIIKFKSLALGSKWIFSRGPVDAGGPLVFPQFALPDYFVSSLQQRLPNVEFTTNPFRIRWCNVKMVFFRENIISKMRRHSLFPKLLLDGNPAEMLVKTLMEQSHLCPMPQAISPLYWNLDQSMSLYPIPDLVVLGDSYNQYVVKEKEYLACNPGSFSADFSFIVIRPSSLEVEESRIPDGDDDDEDQEGEEEGSNVPDLGDRMDGDVEGDLERAIADIDENDEDENGDSLAPDEDEDEDNNDDGGDYDEEEPADEGEDLELENVQEEPVDEGEAVGMDDVDEGELVDEGEAVDMDVDEEPVDEGEAVGMDIEEIDGSIE